MPIGSNTKFPEHITIPEALKVPDGNVFKFALYGIGVGEYKFNESESSWTPLPKREAFFYNYPEEVSFTNSNLMVAKFSGVEMDLSGKIFEGVIKSVLPEDTSFISGKAIGFDYHPELKTIRGVVAQIVTREGETFSDITYVQGFVELARDPPAGSHPDGHICRIPVTATQLYYKSA